MPSKSKQEESGKTIYDFLWLSLQKYGLALLIILIIFLIGGSFLVHKQAEPGTQVSILGVISYTKAKKVESALPSTVLGVTDRKDSVDKEYPHTTVRFAYTKIQRDPKNLIKEAKDVVGKRGYSIWPLDNLPADIFWCNKDYITLVISYWTATNQFTIAAAGPHPEDADVGNEIKAIFKDITGMPL